MEPVSGELLIYQTIAIWYKVVCIKVGGEYALITSADFDVTWFKLLSNVDEEFIKLVTKRKGHLEILNKL